MLTALNTFNGGFLVASRFIYAAARENTLPRQFAKLNLNAKYVAQNDRYAFVEEGLSGKLSADGKSITGQAVWDAGRNDFNWTRNEAQP